jgi:hypothetical protein
MTWLIFGVVLCLAVVLAGRAHSRHLDRMDERRRAISELLSDYRARQPEQRNGGFPPRLVHGAPSVAWTAPVSLPNSWSPAPARRHQKSNA